MLSLALPTACHNGTACMQYRKPPEFLHAPLTLTCPSASSEMPTIHFLFKFRMRKVHFQPAFWPPAEIMPLPVSMSYRFYTLIPEKRKYFSKSLCWNGRKTETAFYQNKRDFFMGNSKSSLKKRQTYSLWKSIVERTAYFLSSNEIH